MQDDLLESARRQAEKGDPSIRAAALLRIARAESAVVEGSRARSTLVEGLDIIFAMRQRCGALVLQHAQRGNPAQSIQLHLATPTFRTAYLSKVTGGFRVIACWNQKNRGQLHVDCGRRDRTVTRSHSQ